MQQKVADGSEEGDVDPFEEEQPSLLEELKLAHEGKRVPEGWSDWGMNKT